MIINRYIYILLLTFICTGLPFQSYSQNFTFSDTNPVVNIDSLEKWLNKNPKPSVQRLKTLIQFHRSAFIAHVFQEPPKKYLEEATKLSAQLNNKTGIACAYLLKSEFIYSPINGKQNRDNLLKALLYFEELKDYSGQTAVYIGLMNLSVSRINDADDKITFEEYQNKILQMLKKYPDPNNEIMLQLLYFKKALYESNNIEMAVAVRRISGLIKKYKQLIAFEKLFKLINAGLFVIDKQKSKEFIESLNKIKEFGPQFTTNENYIRVEYLIVLAESLASMGKHKEAIDAYKVLIEAIISIKEIDKSFMVDTYENYRKVVIAEYKDFKLANSLADSIIKYRVLHYQQKWNEEYQPFMNNYNNQKSLEQKNLLEKSLLIADQNKKAVERNAIIEKQRLVEVALQNKLLANQKNLELTSAQAKALQAELNEKKQKQNNIYLLLLLFSSAIVISTFIYFYLKLTKNNHKLLRMTQSREKLMTILAHDLRTPTNSFQVFSDVINYLVKTKQYNRIKEVSLQINETGFQLQSLLNNIFAWGLSQQNLLTQSPSNVILKNLFETVFPIYESILSIKQIKFSQQISETHEVKASNQILSFIIRNLFDNAVKNTHEGDEIKVFSTANAETISLTISNQYEDLSPQQLQAIFNLFNHHQYYEFGQEGFGVGLLMIQKFIIKNNLNIKVSESAGILSFEIIFDKKA